jgi:hypothetical protein
MRVCPLITRRIFRYAVLGSTHTLHTVDPGEKHFRH